MNPVRRRSVLFLPASNPRAIAKLPTLACDAAILDLEDAVAPAAKPAARRAAVAAVAARGDRVVAIRLNALDGAWGRDDAAAIGASRAAAAVLPKVASAADLVAARAALGEGGPPIWAMIETCAGLLALPAIVAAAAATRTELLIAGTNDLAEDMRCRPPADRWPLIPALAAIVVAARAAGLVALDGVCNALDDPARFAAECAQGAALGFDGKTLIHPAQIAPANAAFAADAATVAQARRIVAAFADPANAGRGAIRLGDAMVERLHLPAAERIVALADAVE